MHLAMEKMTVFRSTLWNRYIVIAKLDCIIVDKALASYNEELGAIGDD